MVSLEKKNYIKASVLKNEKVGQPAKPGQPVKAGQPAKAGHPAKTGQPSEAGQPSKDVNNKAFIKIFIG